jgi:hypothetical protein
MKQARAIISFHDLKAGVLRKTGDAFLCDDDRGEYLAGLGLVHIKDASEEKPKKRKTAKK